MEIGEDVIKRMVEESVWTISVGTDLKTSREVVDLADKHEGIFATIGLHPDSHKGEVFVENDYKELARNKKVIAIGECGLDYFRIKGNSEEIKKRQKENFEKQIQFALENDLPLMLHFRPSGKTMDAYEDGLEILSSYKKTHGDKLPRQLALFCRGFGYCKKVLEYWIYTFVYWSDYFCR